MLTVPIASFTGYQYFYFTMLFVVMTGATTSFFQIGVFAAASRFPHKYLQGVMRWGNFACHREWWPMKNCWLILIIWKSVLGYSGQGKFSILEMIIVSMNCWLWILPISPCHSAGWYSRGSVVHCKRVSRISHKSTWRSSHSKIGCIVFPVGTDHHFDSSYKLLSPTQAAVFHLLHGRPS